MFKYVHHIEYLVHNRDAMIDYLDRTFGMKPSHTEENRKGREAHYDINETQIQFLEPSDPTSDKGKHLATHGPGITHVAWAVDDLPQIAQALNAKGVKASKEKFGTVDAMKIYKPSLESHGYRTFNIDPASSHGVHFQLVGSE